MNQLIELFKAADWQVVNEINSEKDEVDQVINWLDFTKSVSKLNPRISQLEIDEAYLKVSTFSKQLKLKQINEQMFQVLKNGLALKSRKIIKLIDWSRPETNRFTLAVNITISSEGKRQTHPAIGFINGLPLLIIQKNLVGEEYSNLVKNLTSLTPELFYYNPILVFLDERQTRVGSIYSEWINFSQWMQFNDFQVSDEWEVVIRQLVNKEFLLAIIQSFLLSDIYGVMEKGQAYLSKLCVSMDLFLFKDDYL